MSIDWTLNAGNILVYIVAVLGAFWRLYTALDKRISIFEQILSTHATMLRTNTERMDKHEERILTIVESLQRLIGRAEIPKGDRT